VSVCCCCVRRDSCLLPSVTSFPSHLYTHREELSSGTALLTAVIHLFSCFLPIVRAASLSCNTHTPGVLSFFRPGQFRKRPYQQRTSTRVLSPGFACRLPVEEQFVCDTTAGLGTCLIGSYPDQNNTYNNRINNVSSHQSHFLLRAAAAADQHLRRRSAFFTTTRLPHVARSLALRLPRLRFGHNSSFSPCLWDRLSLHFRANDRTSPKQYPKL
jgi:hypothetical protein